MLYDATVHWLERSSTFPEFPSFASAGLTEMESEDVVGEYLTVVSLSMAFGFIAALQEYIHHSVLDPGQSQTLHPPQGGILSAETVVKLFGQRQDDLPLIPARRDPCILHACSLPSCTTEI